MLGREFHELGAGWVKYLCPYRTVLILGIASVREFCDLSIQLPVTLADLHAPNNPSLIDQLIK